MKRGLPVSATPKIFHLAAGAASAEAETDGAADGTLSAETTGTAEGAAEGATSAETAGAAAESTATPAPSGVAHAIKLKTKQQKNKLFIIISRIVILFLQKSHVLINILHYAIKYYKQIHDVNF